MLTGEVKKDCNGDNEINRKHRLLTGVGHLL